MSKPGILPDVESDNILNYLGLCLQDPQAGQNVVRSIDKQVSVFDVKEQLEVHGDAKLNKDPQNPQRCSFQAMDSGPHEAQSLSTSQPPGNKVKQQPIKRQSNKRNRPSMAEGPTLHVLHLRREMTFFESLDQSIATLLVC